MNWQPIVKVSSVALRAPVGTSTAMQDFSVLADENGRRIM
jgi:hypothetical protein